MRMLSTSCITLQITKWYRQMNIEKRLRYVISEAVRNALNENSYDRALNNFIKNYFGTESFEQTRDLLFNVIYKNFPDLRHFNNKEAVINVIEYFFLPDTSIHDKERLNDLKYVMHILLSDSKEESKAKSALDALASPGMDFGETVDYVVDNYFPSSFKGSEEYANKTAKTPNGYTVTRIDRFGEIENLNAGTGWCVADDPEYFRSYIGDHGTPYFVEKRYNWDDMPDDYYDNLMDKYYEYETFPFFELVNQPDCGKFGSWKFPYDINGLSALFVIVYPNRHMDVWSQWNLTDENGKYLTKQQLSQLIGIDADKVIVPVRGMRK